MSAIRSDGTNVARYNHSKLLNYKWTPIITPATIYVKAVIPAKAGIQNWPGCRIKSGMTFDMFDGFVKSPTSAFRCILRHCGVP